MLRDDTSTMGSLPPLEDELGDDPIDAFGRWQRAAQDAGEPDPTAFCLATATPEGDPAARVVLLKEANDAGFVFYTNRESRKGRELGANPRAAAVFFWARVLRQVRVEGPVARVPDTVSDAYFASRPRDSQLGAWASAQSEPLSSRRALIEAVQEAARRYPDQVPRPPHWGGYCLRPTRIEFWRPDPHRLNDRVEFRAVAGGGWERARLFP